MFIFWSFSCIFPGPNPITIFGKPKYAPGATLLTSRTRQACDTRHSTPQKTFQPKWSGVGQSLQARGFSQSVALSPAKFCAPTSPKRMVDGVIPYAYSWMSSVTGRIVGCIRLEMCYEVEEPFGNHPTGKLCNYNWFIVCACYTQLFTSKSPVDSSVCRTISKAHSKKLWLTRFRKVPHINRNSMNV